MDKILSNNFQFLEKKEYKKFISKNRNPKTKTIFQQLIYIIKDIEFNCQLRNFDHWYLDIRLFLEVFTIILENILVENIDNYVLSISQYANSEDDEYRKINYDDLFKKLLIQTKYKFNVPFIKKYKSLRSESNKSLHFYTIFFSNVRGTYKKKIVNLEKAIDCIHKIQYLLIEFFLILQNTSLERSDNSFEELRNFHTNFLKIIYEDTTKMWQGSFFVKNILDYENTSCHFCEIGKLVKPISVFSFGPFLQCDNSSCGAILSINLRLRRILENNCPKCKMNKTKEEYDLEKKTSRYHCNSETCSWEDKKK